MQSGSVPLINLIRLLEGRLPEQAVAVLRERVAVDEAVRDRLKAVQAVRRETNPGPEVEAADVATDAERLALLIDGQGTAMDDDWCLSAEHRIREVISVERGTVTAGEATVIPPGIRRRWHAQLERECATAQTVEKPRQQPTDPDRLPPRISRRPSRHRRRSQTRPQSYSTRRTALLLTPVVLIVIVSGWMLWWHRSTELTSLPVDPQRSAEEIVDLPELSPPPNPRLQPPPDGGDNTQSLVVRSPDNSNSPAPIVDPPDYRSVPNPAGTPDRPVDSKPLVWTRTVGMLAAYDANADLWRGVRSPELSNSDAAPVRYRGWPESWGQAAGDSGVVFTLAGQTEALIGMGSLAELAVSAQLIEGQLALSQLPADAQLEVTLKDWALSMTATEPHTEVALSSLATDQQLSVLAGAVRIGDQVISAPAAVRRSGSDLIVAALRQRPAWCNDPDRAIIARLADYDRLQDSPDLLTSLVDDLADQPDTTVRTQAALAFDVDPARTIARATESPRESMRSAAVDWLLKTPVDRPESIAAWRSLESLTSATSLRVHAWVAAVQQGTAVRRQEFWQELAAGIGTGESLFVRQMSIHLLRNLSGQPFSNYDAANPSAIAIREVRLHVRQIVTRLSPQRLSSPQRRQQINNR